MNDEHYQKLANELGVGKEVFEAVARVESKGQGVIRNKAGVLEAKILYERHKMYGFLKKKMNKEKLSLYVSSQPKLVNPKGGGYGGYLEQFIKLENAKKIDIESAIKSCSWGKYQIMGKYFRDGNFYNSPQDLEIAMNMCELQHFAYFNNYLKKGLT
nr:N-acetylmuramidase domain-containing protein [Neisseria dumasiana]